jgi:hypothetical protein
VIPELWPNDERRPDAFTTIATWENKGKNIAYEGAEYYWSKHVNFLRFLDVPKRVARPFTMAVLTPTDAVTAEISDNGWRVIDPRPVSAGMTAYAEFIAGSRGEFTVAKDIYVRPNSGWFSDRSVCYLAAGRPVVTMRTGFSKFYPAGAGLFEFSTMDEILAAFAAIDADYSRHSRAAREIAVEYFAADRVLSRLMNESGL